MKKPIILIAALIALLCVAADKLPEFKILGRVDGDFRFQSELTNAVWVAGTRGFHAGECGYLSKQATKGIVSDRFTIPDKAWVWWRFESEKKLRTNEVDVSSLPIGNHRGVLVLTLTTNRTWRATFEPKK